MEPALLVNNAPARSASLSALEARRIALRAQGIGRRRPDCSGRDRLLGVFDRLGLVQMDSVNVLARAHYLPFYTRCGEYPCGLLDRLAYSPRRRLFEYWGHEASLIDLRLYPFFRWRMERAANGAGTYRSLARLAKERPAFVAEVLAAVAAHGPSGASAVEARVRSQSRKGSKGWWGWSETKQALEYLFWSGQITTCRRRHFERIYDLSDRVLPAELVNAPPAPADEAHRQLVRVAARALGVATSSDLARYFRLGPQEVRARVAELVEAGELQPVRVEGWAHPAYLSAAAPRPRRVEAAALVSPFDPLLWERPRTARVFGLQYRIEIYTPAARRQHGYYVLPFLLGERFAARLDLKAERALHRLQVCAAHLEPGHTAGQVLEPLRAELDRLRRWLGLRELSVSPRGDLAPALAARGP